MKKLMIVALMAVAASTAFAGTSPALKSILKAKTYAEAESLLKSSLSQLADDAEKAAAYNKLVDLAMDKVTHEKATMATNAAVLQMGGGGKVEAVDTAGMNTALLQAVEAAIECDKYDQKPDAKGKIKPKFHEKNAQRIFQERGDIANAGITFYQNNDGKNAYKYFSKYVDIHNESLFAEEMAKLNQQTQAAGGDDPDNTSQFAYLAAYYAYQNHDIDACNKYCDIAMKDPKWAKDARNLKLSVVQESLKTRQDSLNYVEKLKEQLAAEPNDENLFGTLVNMYSALKMNDAMESLFNDKLKVDPNNFVVWAVRGQNAMMDQKLDDAVNYFKKALETQPDNAQILTYLGACQLDRGSQAENRAAGKTGRVPQAAMDQIRPIYEEALGYLQKAKSLDPNKEKANWGYPLYRCCYQLYGENDPRTQAAEADTK